MQRSIATDIESISRISAVPSILQVICATTGLRFAAIARVTDNSWTACAVLDNIDLGLKAGDPLDVATTLCSEVRDSRAPVIIDQASTDAHYCSHRTPRLYGFESYISVPLFRVGGAYFGTLCALDPLPAKVSDPKVISMMQSFSELISLQLEAEEKLEESQAALLNARETAELREQFIAVLGHDLRNPLFSISAGTDILLRRPLDRETRSIAERIQASCRRMSRLVDDVLDFARGRLGRGIPLDRQYVTGLEEDLRHVVAELQSAYPERAIRCLIDACDMLFCDRHRVAQLLSNLLANALMHGSPDHPVDVSARIRAGGLTLSVTNQGTPIPADTIPRLFQPYWRPASNGPQAGLGLGLYISAEIARSHGGSIDVSSSAKSGTTFTFTLPAH
jgi:sigma-B regulation protein RsbU (phosphoserine phosphatase)